MGVLANMDRPLVPTFIPPANWIDFMCRYLIAFVLALNATLPAAAFGADGDLDPNFANAGRALIAFDLGSTNRDEVTGMAIRPDGRIWLVGTVEHAPDIVGIGLASLKANGEPDDSFSQQWHLPNGLAHAQLYDAALQNDGKLVAAGVGYQLNFVLPRALVCRFMPDGSLDSTFATIDNIIAPGCRLVMPDKSGGLAALTIQSNGRIVLAGRIDTGNYHGLVVRLDAQGNFDNSFHGDGIHVLLPQSPNYTILTDVTQGPDGKLVAVGHASVGGNFSWRVFKLRDDDGALDTSFDVDGVKPIGIDLIPAGYDLAESVHVLPDGTVLVGGTAGASPENDCPALARLTPGGQFDPLLDGDGLYVDPFCADTNVSNMLVQSDGRIVLAGGLDGDFFALRITPEGERDASFGYQGLRTIEFGPLHDAPIALDGATRIVSQNGRLLLAGFTQPSNDNGRQDFVITRLENDLIFADDLE